METGPHGGAKISTKYKRTPPFQKTKSWGTRTQIHFDSLNLTHPPIAAVPCAASSPPDETSHAVSPQDSQSAANIRGCATPAPGTAILLNGVSRGVPFLSVCESVGLVIFFRSTTQNPLPVLSPRHPPRGFRIERTCSPKTENRTACISA
jgi:hypothetical protein